MAWREAAGVGLVGEARRSPLWLGHRTLQMTMRYAHLASNDLNFCVPVLERAHARRTPERESRAH